MLEGMIANSLHPMLHLQQFNLQRGLLVFVFKTAQPFCIGIFAIRETDDVGGAFAVSGLFRGGLL